MPYSILGFFTGFGIGRSVGLDDSQAARVGIIPGILGFKIVPILVAKAVADREAESLPPPVLQNAKIGVDPVSHNYGEVRVLTTDRRIFVVSNSGTAELVVTQTTLTGTIDNQFVIGSGGAPFNVAPGATRDVIVNFIPNSVGPKSASLDIACNDPDQSIVKITLSGTGVIPDIAAPASIDCGRVNVGSNSLKPFVVTNSGNEKLVVFGITLTGTNDVEFFLLGGATFEVAPGATQNLVVVFTPNSVGAKSAKLAINSNDPDKSRVEIALSGEGINPNP